MSTDIFTQFYII